MVTSGRRAVEHSVDGAKVTGHNETSSVKLLRR
jgi:hypothetical protein